MKKIPLSQNRYIFNGEYALVDDEDYEWLIGLSLIWRIIQKGRNRYVVRSMKVAQNVWCSKYMHVDILEKYNGKYSNIGDHINGNGLDNRKENLRLVTCQQNSMNSRSHVGSTSKYKGVVRTRTGMWNSNISIKNKNKFILSTCNEVFAARAYDTMARKYYGEYAKLNFPELHDINLSMKPKKRRSYNKDNCGCLFCVLEGQENGSK